MIFKNLKFCLIILIINSCNSKDYDEVKNQWKEEIRKTEQDFSALLQEKGIYEAFVHYADKEAVLMRNNILIKGKESIKEYFKNKDTKSLSWSPDFIEVSNSGDLGYTYGTYQFKYKDSLGNELVDEGIFHTVWKRQLNGEWKFVWD